MSRDTTYTDPWAQPGENPELFLFDLNIGGRTVAVTISREAIEDDAANRGLPEPRGREAQLDHIRTYQPELVAIAVRKHRLLETVDITADDIAT